MPSEQRDRASEHESTRPQCPNRSPLPTSTTHHRPAMLTSDARPRSLPRKPTRLKLVPHNYNSKKKTTNGPSPPEKNQNPPKNSRNRSGPPNLDPHNYNPLKKTFTGPPPFEKKNGTSQKTLAIGAGPGEISDTQRVTTLKRVGFLTTLQRVIDPELGSYCRNIITISNKTTRNIRIQKKRPHPNRKIRSPHQTWRSPSGARPRLGRPHISHSHHQQKQQEAAQQEAAQGQATPEKGEACHRPHCPRNHHS